jgi:hypothetical protein
MSDFKFNCPHCQQSLEAPQDMLGTVIDCPSCNKRIQLPKPHLRAISKIKCLFGSHEWEGCKCMSCGHVRDIEHRWSRCKCDLCGKTREVEESNHAWDGCKCSLCGKTRDWGHVWGPHCCSKCGTRLSADETAKRWAEQLGRKQDYRSLTAYCCSYGSLRQDDSSLWNAKRSYAYKTLRQAGANAVDAMLAELECGESKDDRIADILMEIGDPKAVPLLKRFLERDVWGCIGGQNSKTREFVDRFPQFQGDVEKVACAICGKVRPVTETKPCADKRFCEGVCWSRRGRVIRHGIGSNCPHYQEGVCMAGGRDTGLCSLQEGTYHSSCNVYALHPA